MEIMDIFNVVCGACSVVGLLVSVFTASKVIKISQIINNGNKDDHSNVVNKNSKSTFNETYVGRDSINGTGNNKQK